MDCDQAQWLNNVDYQKQFNRKAAEKRIPLSGSIDITRRCNLKCVHCYRPGVFEKQDNVQKELTTRKWVYVIDELTDAGCLYFLITGGEPLSRSDFTEIYTHAKKSGLIVTVFTNGTLINDSVIELFKEFPPYAVEITLYGATCDTYEKITGVPGSYEKCMSGIQKLVNNNISTKLKTILMAQNLHEFDAIAGIAEAYKLKFRFDAGIFPKFNGDKSPLTMRVSPHEAVEKEFSDRKRLTQWREYYHRMKESPESDLLYNCGTGLTSFHIDSSGNLQPCLMVDRFKFNLSNGSFLEGWHGVVSGVRKEKAGSNFACNKCNKILFCGYCPAFFRLENGSEDIPSEYLCAIGHHRFQAINGSICMEE